MKTPINSLIPAIGRLFGERLLPKQTIVGIFDNARYLDKVVARSENSGVYDWGPIDLSIAPDIILLDTLLVAQVFDKIGL